MLRPDLPMTGQMMEDGALFCFLCHLASYMRYEFLNGTVLW